VKKLFAINEICDYLQEHKVRLTTKSNGSRKRRRASRLKLVIVWSASLT
jgi:hypothetical protein